MIKNSLLFLILGLIFFVLIQVNNDLTSNLTTATREFFLANTLFDTGSKTIVTGIYLDYRLFDSILEASTLLIVVSGIIFISREDEIDSSSIMILDRMRSSNLLITISRMLFPFMLMFGLYIIVHGHLSPGGGFQGGAILATAVLITYYITPQKIPNLKVLVTIDKITFLLILVITSLSVFTRGYLFTNIIPTHAPNELRVLFIIFLNMLIAIKVCIGLVGIFSSFLKEGH